MMSFFALHKVYPKLLLPVNSFMTEAHIETSSFIGTSVMNELISFAILINFFVGVVWVG